MFVEREARPAEASRLALRKAYACLAGAHAWISPAPIGSAEDFWREAGREPGAESDRKAHRIRVSVDNSGARQPETYRVRGSLRLSDRERVSETRLE